MANLHTGQQATDARTVGNWMKSVVFSPLPQVPAIGQWYRVAPKDAVAANGAPYHAQISFGCENRVLFFFHGGGLSWSAAMAAHPKRLDTSGEAGFYCDDMGPVADAMATSGICDRTRPDNPFRTWTIVSFPYSTGDCHCGTSDFCYLDQQGRQQVLHHHGYTNFRLVMEQLLARLGAPQQIAVAGYSAGGIGAALLSPVLLQMFPHCRDFTCLMDSSLILMENWSQVLRQVWKAPEEIVRRVRSNNLVLDMMEAMVREKAPGCRLRVLFDCSVRDNELARISTYVHEGTTSFTEKSVPRFEADLKQMCLEMVKNLPDCCLYLFDTPACRIPAGEQQRYHLTHHTLIHSPRAYACCGEADAVIHWIGRALGGNPQNVGLKLLGLEPNP